MEESKKPSLDKVIKKLEELDIREWECIDSRFGHKFIARVGGLTVHVFKTDVGTLRKYHKIEIINREGINREGERRIDYFSYKKRSVEEKCISKLYDRLRKEYEEHHKKEFEETLEQVFSY